MNIVFGALFSKLMNPFSSVFLGASFFSNIFTVIGILLRNLVEKLAEFAYFINKWAMYVTDVLYLYIRQLSGVNVDTSSLEAITSGESDMVFNFLINNKDMVTKIMRALIVITIVLIIVTTIIAVIKQQFDSMTQEKASNDGKEILKHTFKAFLLMIMTPLLALIGIIASNVLISALDKATNLSSADSLSARVFTASASTANRYRIYADNGVRIPIIIDFSGSDTETYEYNANYAVQTFASSYFSPFDNFASSTTYESVKGVYNYTTYDFMKHLEEIDKYESGSSKVITNNGKTIYDYKQFIENYYSHFDHGTLIEGDDNNDYKRIIAYEDEYFVMADMLEFAMETMDEFYFVNIETLLKSQLAVPEIGETLVKETVRNFSIELLGTEIGAETNPAKIIHDGKYDRISYTIKYSYDESASHTYVHLKDAIDEAEGAKFVMAVKQQTKVNNETKYYYTPVYRGFKAENGASFDSNYILRGQLIQAKGIFDKSGYPTAIRQSSNGDIIFYRQDLEVTAAGEAAGLGKVTPVEQDENGGIKAAFSAVKNFVTSLFRPARLVPQLDFDTSKVTELYTTRNINIYTLSEGKMHVSYFFADTITSSLSIDGFRLYHLFVPTKINFIVLTVGIAMFLKVCFSAIFGFVSRSFDLFLLILFYPLACSTLPLDSAGGAKDTGYKKWTSTFMKKLFSTYALILGFNFVLLLFPVVESIQFISKNDLATNIVVQRVASVLSPIASKLKVTDTIMYEKAAKFLNTLIVIMSQVILASLIDPKGDIFTKIAEIAGGDNLDSNVGKNVKKIISDTAGVVNFLISPPQEKGKIILKKVQDVFGEVAASLPGSALMKKKNELKSEVEGHAARENAKKELLEAVKRKDSKQEVQAKLDAFNKAYGTNAGKK